MLDKNKLNEIGVIKRRSIFGTALIVMAIWSLLVTFMSNVALLPYGIVSGIVGIFFFKTKLSNLRYYQSIQIYSIHFKRKKITVKKYS